MFFGALYSSGELEKKLGTPYHKTLPHLRTNLIDIFILLSGNAELTACLPCRFLPPVTFISYTLPRKSDKVMFGGCVMQFAPYNILVKTASKLGKRYKRSLLNAQAKPRQRF